MATFSNLARLVIKLKRLITERIPFLSSVDVEAIQFASLSETFLLKNASTFLCLTIVLLLKKIHKSITNNNKAPNY